MAVKSFILSAILAVTAISSCAGNELQTPSPNKYVTQTVYGFLDFTTTIGDTIMIFLPNSAPSFEIPINSSPTAKTENIINTQPYKKEEANQHIKPSKSVSEKRNKVLITSSDKPSLGHKVISSKVGVVDSKKKIISKVEVKEAATPFVAVSVVGTQVAPNDEPYTIYNDLDEPEYDFLSRQPPAYAEESYKIINVKPSTNQKHRGRTEVPKNPAGKEAQPTGLVTKLSGTVIKDGVTTIHETSVIGTFISNRYAQVLQSSSHVYKNNKPKLSPSSTVRILKTAAPSSSISFESTPSSIRPSSKNRRPDNNQSNKIQNRFRNKNRREETPKQDAPVIVESSPAPSNSFSRKDSKSRRHKNNSSLRTTPLPPASQNDSSGRRSFKPKIQAANVNTDPSTTLYKFKLNRTPGRWQYKTSPKPRIAIRKSVDSENNLDESPSVSRSVVAEPEVNSKENIVNQKGDQTDSQINDLESDTPPSASVKFFAETLNVEISTPPDFKETYYEIATIKTPYTFQVGTVKNTRFITVTSTFEKSFEPESQVTLNPNEPLTENILASTKTNREVNLLDSSIGTLPTLYLSSDEATIPLETMTETYSLTQNVLKTQVLPIIQEGKNATSLTLIHTYRLTRLVTATKTLPPSEAYQFVASKRLKEFNSKLDEAGSELHLELEFGDNNDEDGDDEDEFEDSEAISSLLKGDSSDFDLLDRSKSSKGEHLPKKSKKPQHHQIVSELPHNSNMPQFSPAQLQQLALLGLLNPGAPSHLPQVITTSKPIIKLETIYESHVIPFYNGHSTSYSTISKSVGTKETIDYEFITSTVALPLPPVPQNPLFQQQPQIQITTTPIVTQTFATETQSKVLKLTFGAKTAYTTIYSTKVVPTVLTTFITASISLQPSAPAFPGYYPAPFAPYPYVG